MVGAALLAALVVAVKNAGGGVVQWSEIIQHSAAPKGVPPNSPLAAQRIDNNANAKG